MDTVTTLNNRRTSQEGANEKPLASSTAGAAFSSENSSSSEEKFDTLTEDQRVNGELHRGLKARQIGMISIGGAIGTGLIIGSGTALARGGPIGMLLGYAIMGAVCFAVMISLGEMATFLPHNKGFSGYASRFWHESAGMALGYNYLLKYLIVTPNNITAGVLIVQYWTKAVPVAVWVTLFILVIVTINVLGVKVFGEVEFWMSTMKVLVLTGLIIMGLVIDLGGVGPSYDRIGFRYWKSQPFSHYLFPDRDLGVFLGVWSVMVSALFAYMGTELIGVTVGECQNPRKNVPLAIKRTFWRILIFYIGSVFVVGLIVPANDPRLLDATKASTSAAASPFVVAITIAGIKVLPSIINAALLLFVTSAASSDLYIGSRTLYALAAEGKAPRVFLRCNRWGTPYVALTLCTAACGLAYLSVSTDTKVIFTYFVALVTIFGVLTWMSILYTHLCFMAALKAQGISRDTLPYKAPGQPYVTYVALVVAAIVTLFKGFDTFIKPSPSSTVPAFNYKNFITSYLGLPIFLIIFLGHRYYTGARTIASADVDLISGQREIEEDAREWVESEGKKNLTWYQKLWDGA